MFIDHKEEQLLHVWDKELHRYPAFFNLLKILEPINAREQLKIFIQKQGAYDPQFQYNFPDQEAMNFIQNHLQKVKSTYAEKIFKSEIAQLLREKGDEYENKFALMQAYKDQDFAKIALYNEKIFGKINQAYLEESEMMLQKSSGEKSPDTSQVFSREEVIHYLRTYLDDHGFNEVQIQQHAQMPYRVAIKYTSKNIILRLGGFSSLSKTTVDAIIAHEIQTHIQRYFKGRASGWLLLKYGTSGSVIDEEGFAIYNALQIYKKGSPQHIQKTIYQKYLLTHYASTHSFSETAKYLQTLAPQKSLNALYNGVLRCKMGIMNTALQTQGALFNRDSIFLTGYHRILEWIENGGNTQKLFLGKIKKEDIGVLN